jgi:glycosyltransferase involved in cell wall biosynthesis
MLWRKRVCRTVHRVIAPSHYIAEEAVTNGIAQERVSVIPHYTEKNPEGVMIRAEANTVLFVGRRDPLKGLAEFLKALHSIRDEAWTACVIGGESTGERLAAELGLAGRVRFIPMVPYAELDSYYQRASILAFPSISPESFGLVGLEAMSFGRPVVAFDSGGPREWLRHGETGFLVGRADIGEFARSLRTLLRNRDLAARMGASAMQRVAAHFRKRTHLDSLLAAYQQAQETYRNA